MTGKSSNSKPERDIAGGMEEVSMVSSTVSRGAPSLSVLRLIAVTMPLLRGSSLFRMDIGLCLASMSLIVAFLRTIEMGRKAL